MRGGGRQSHRGLGLIYALALSKCVFELVTHEKMSWMFSIWAAGALLTVCRGQDAVHAGRSSPTLIWFPFLSEPIPVSPLDWIYLGHILIVECVLIKVRSPWRGENGLHFVPGRSLSASGYHLCVRNTTRTVTFLAVHKVPFSVTKPCGGWLLWKTCTVTEYRMSHQTEYKTVTEQETSCCQGYVQVGRYCTACESAESFAPVNRRNAV